MTATPLTDQQLADSHLLDQIQDEVDSKPPHYYRFNGGLYVPKVLPLAQALRADRDRLAAELDRVRAELAVAREQTAEAIVAGLTAIHDHSETAERNRPGLRMAMRNAHRFVAPPAAAVPSA